MVCSSCPTPWSRRRGRSVSISRPRQQTPLPPPRSEVPAWRHAALRLWTLTGTTTTPPRVGSGVPRATVTRRCSLAPPRGSSTSCSTDTAFRKLAAAGPVPSGRGQRRWHGALACCRPPWAREVETLRRTGHRRCFFSGQATRARAGSASVRAPGAVGRSLVLCRASDVGDIEAPVTPPSGSARKVASTRLRARYRPRFIRGDEPRFRLSLRGYRQANAGPASDRCEPAALRIAPRPTSQNAKDAPHRESR
jgi:hypothetical protein